MLHELERGQAVEHRVRALADKALHGLLAAGAGHLEVAQRRLDGLPVGPAHRVQAGQACQRLDLSIGMNAEGALELETQVLIEQGAAAHHSGIKLASKRLFHSSKPDQFLLGLMKTALVVLGQDLGSFR